MARMPVNPRVGTTREQRSWEYENFEYLKTVLHPNRAECCTIWSVQSAWSTVPEKIQKYSLGLEYLMNLGSSRYIARRHLRVRGHQSGTRSWVKD